MLKTRDSRIPKETNHSRVAMDNIGLVSLLKGAAIHPGRTGTLSGCNLVFPVCGHHRVAGRLSVSHWRAENFY